MDGCERRGSSIEVIFDEGEPSFLLHLIDQYRGLLGYVPGEDDHRDPFTRWEQEMSAPNSQDILDLKDPALARLFPDAYPTDASASDEFRDDTLDVQRRLRLDDAGLVIRDLSTVGDDGLCVIATEDVPAWLKTINAIRITVAARLGIHDDRSAEKAARMGRRDPRSRMYTIYSWLGWVQQSLLECLEAA